MRHRLPLVFLALVVGALAHAQGFGRFGYAEIPTIPGFTLDREGFVAKFGAAEKFSFSTPPSSWKVGRVSDAGEEIDLGNGSIAIDLLAPGFMLKQVKGFSLHLRSTSAPFLTWKEASVGEGVPTPSLRWIAVSFKQSQPPVVFGFLDSDVSLQIDGKVGDWTLHASKPYRGWVRVALPMGTQPLATDSAASLGKLSSIAQRSSELWWRPAPELKSFSIHDEDTAVEATWKFDRKGAIVPVGAAMANLGKYPLTIKSKTYRLDGYNEEGPVTVCDDDSLTIHFPIDRIPLGRPLTVGAPDSEPIGTVSAFDVGGIVELAFENLLSARDMRSRNTAETTVDQFVQEANYLVEPHTNQRLPFPADGKGIDAVAANALLYEAYTLSSKSSSEENPLMTSVVWRRDWYTWRIWTDDVRSARRSGAFIAFAGALCTEPERRLDAAISQAGLAGERGVGIFLSRMAHQVDEPRFLEPIWDIRNAIFHMTQSPKHPGSFVDGLLAPVRIFGDTSVRCVSDPSGGLQIRWSDSPSLVLASSFPLLANGTGIVATPVLGYTRLMATGNGEHMAVLHLPAWARSLPAFVAPPRYEEPVN